MGMAKRLVGSKTAWVAVAGIATAIGAYVGGEIGLQEAVKACFLGLGTLFLRDGIAKGK